MRKNFAEGLFFIAAVCVGGIVVSFITQSAHWFWFCVVVLVLCVVLEQINHFTSKGDK